MSAASILMSPPVLQWLNLHLMPSRGAGFTEPSEPRKNKKRKDFLSIFHKMQLRASQHVRNENNPHLKKVVNDRRQ